METDLVWTGEYQQRAGLLYQSYANRGIVYLDGQEIGYVLELWNGMYQPRLAGMMDNEQATAVDAVARVVYMHKTFRSRSE